MSDRISITTAKGIEVAVTTHRERVPAIPLDEWFTVPARIEIDTHWHATPPPETTLAELLGPAARGRLWSAGIETADVDAVLHAPLTPPFGQPDQTPVRTGALDATRTISGEHCFALILPFRGEVQDVVVAVHLPPAIAGVLEDLTVPPPDQPPASLWAEVRSEVPECIDHLRWEVATHYALRNPQHPRRWWYGTTAGSVTINSR